uniref:Uncharacterized protein n=1 Tax=Anguilla anguilla TaxID=7936 RepID=A0A0E9TPY5_ANGAN
MQLNLTQEVHVAHLWSSTVKTRSAGLWYSH